MITREAFTNTAVTWLNKIMFVLSYCIVVSLILLSASIAYSAENTAENTAETNASNDISFQKFLQATERARPSDFVGRPNARVADEGAFQSMKAHVLSLYRGIDIKRSFLGRSGQEVADCVPIDQQPGLRGQALPRELPPPFDLPVASPDAASPDQANPQTPVDIALTPGEKDRLNNEMYCPEGQIPMRRVTLDEITKFKSLDEFLHRGKRPPPLGGREQSGGEQSLAGTETHYYAIAYQFVNNRGASSWLNLWNPKVSTGAMSLSQMWIIGGSGSTTQTVEVGWQRSPTTWGNNSALFIFFTPDNYKTGCYNLECSGFVQLASNIFLGSGWSTYSTLGGTQYAIALQWNLKADKRWYLYYKGTGEWIVVGYYPASAYGTGQLSRNSTEIHFGGEDTGNPTTALEMGSGKKSLGGLGQAAYQNGISYVDMTMFGRQAILNTFEPNVGCYTATVYNRSSTSWQTYMYFGGPSCSTGLTAAAPVEGLTKPAAEK
jgi:hypothetical protein